MPIIRKVYGPFGFTEKKVQAHTGAGWSVVIAELRWHFHGVRGDYTMAHWVLAYDVKTRTFQASNIQLGDNGLDRKKLIAAGLGNWEPTPDPALREVFIGSGLRIWDGRIVDILRAHLPATELAKATAASITRPKL